MLYAIAWIACAVIAGMIGSSKEEQVPDGHLVSS